MSALDPVLRAVITICILVFSAKILGELFAKIKIPSVLGELLAGILLGPYAFGSILAVGGNPLVQTNNDLVRAFGEIGGILILFAAGLEMTFKEFRHVGSASFVTGTVGVVVPFVMGYGISAALGFGAIASMVVAAALTATSISITSIVLNELNQSRTIEARVMIGAAVIDDVLGLAVLGVVVSFISGGEAINPLNVLLVILESLALWLVLVVVIQPILPRVINFASHGKAEETVEAAATASCFGAAAIAAAIGLSPIVGAFAAGMAVASSHAIEKIRDYAKKISVIFSPVFFALAGAAFNVRSFLTSDVGFYVFFVVLVLVAIASKMIGCGLPAWEFLKSRDKGLKVGVGMISRGEVGLIVAGVAVTSEAINQNVYSAIVGMVMITTVLTPILLKFSYDKEKEKYVPPQRREAEQALAAQEGKNGEQETKGPNSP